MRVTIAHGKACRTGMQPHLTPTLSLKHIYIYILTQTNCPIINHTSTPTRTCSVVPTLGVESNFRWRALLRPYPRVALVAFPPRVDNFAALVCVLCTYTYRHHLSLASLKDRSKDHFDLYRHVLAQCQRTSYPFLQPSSH